MRLKRLLVIVPLAAALFVMGTGNALAATGFVKNEADFPVLDAATSTVRLKTTGFSEGDFDFIREFLASDSKDWYVCGCYGVSNSVLPGVPIIRIYHYASLPSAISYSKYSSGYWRFDFSSSLGSWLCMTFLADSGEPYAVTPVKPDSSYVGYGSASSSIKDFAAYMPIYYPFLTGSSVDPAKVNDIWSGALPGSTVNFIFEGLNDTPPPASSEPEPPVSSEPDPPPVVSYPDFPTVGEVDSPYVPYDTTVWNQFTSFVKGRIGAAVNIGFIILAVLLGFWVCTRIIRKFTGG